MSQQPTRQFSVGGRQVGDGRLPYVIAEIGVNHEGSLERALELIDLAKAGGADAAKFQTYKAERLASAASPAYWDTTKEPTLSQRALFAKYDRFGEPEYRRLAAHCAEKEIDFLSTPFDLDAVDMLAPLVPIFKIASADVTNVPLLRRVASWKKPVMLSVGASTLEEAHSAVDLLASSGCPEVAVLHCILNYPTDYPDANLNMIRDLQRHFPNHVIGYSDHTVPDPAMTVLTTAYLKGARILEKHFTHDKTLPGNDHYHAMDVDDLRRYCKQIALIASIEGSEVKGALANEDAARRNARRSIVLQRPVAKGAALSADDLTCKRPGTGISPSLWDEIVGRRAAQDLPEDHILGWDDLT
jgi:sialic acid synthase SpsE